MSSAPEDATAPAVARELRSARSVLVCAHKNPDGDAIGSAIASVLLLRAMGKKAVGHCPGPMLAHFREIPQIELLAPQIAADGNYDLTLILDCSDLERISDDFLPRGRSVNIDHHKTNNRFADLNWVDPVAASTGEMLAELARELDVQPTPEMARALYLAVVTDTGGFRYANTRPETFAVAERMVSLGADPSEAARLYWGNSSAESVRLRAAALGRLEIDAAGRLAWSQLSAEDYAQHGGMTNEPEGLSGELRGIYGIEVGLLFTEVKDEGVRISMRSRGRVDVAEVAAQFGGGGHKAAAGAFVKASLDETRERVLVALRAALKGIGV
jgi:phosphoesterase RecJ-like protein